MGPGPIPLCISSNLLCFAALSASQLYQSVLNAHHIPSRSQNEICPFSLMLFYFCQYFHLSVQSKTFKKYIFNFPKFQTQNFSFVTLYSQVRNINQLKLHLKQGQCQSAEIVHAGEEKIIKKGM